MHAAAYVTAPSRCVSCSLACAHGTQGFSPSGRYGSALLGMPGELALVAGAPRESTHAEMAGGVYTLTL